MNLGFISSALTVIDERSKHIGKVVGYTLEAGNFVIQQLRVRRPLFKSFNDTELLIHRKQIVKVTDDRVVVKSNTVKSPEPVEPVIDHAPIHSAKSRNQRSAGSQSSLAQSSSTCPSAVLTSSYVKPSPVSRDTP